jgi:hypothetical protein
MPRANPLNRVKAPPSIAFGAAAGVALGGSYVASPLSVWFAVLMIGVFVWAGRGLSERERRYVWGILAVAVAVRVLAIGALFIVSDPNVLTSFFWDGDGVYLKRRAMTIRQFWLGIPVQPVLFSRAFDHGYGWSSYLYVLAYLQYLTGPAPYGVHLFNVALFVAAAVALYRLIRPSFGRAPALVGLALMLFFPTLVAWSVSALKESLYLFLSVLGLRAAVAGLRAARAHQRLAGWVVLLGAIAANRTVRTGAGVIMIAGLGSGLVGSIVVRRVLLIVLVIVCLPLAMSRLWQHPDLRATIMSQIKASAVQHRGAVKTSGNTYKTLDRRMYSDPAAIDEMTTGEARRFIVRALLSFVAVPLPWQIVSRSEMVFLAQQMIWYVLLVFACVGFVAGLRHDALLTCMLAGLSAVGAATIALNSGNIGSLVRFRDTVVPFMVWLSALGAVSTLSGLLSRRRIMMRSAECL